MATKRQQPEITSRDISLLEAMVSLQTRGRSVVNGTILSGGEVQTFTHELSELEKHQFRELIVSAFLHNRPGQVS